MKEKPIIKADKIPDKFKGSNEQLDIALKVFTCYECIGHEKCEFAWDHYNTDGFCIAEK